MVTKGQYDALLEDRPTKFSASDVQYRPGKGKAVCWNCVHFYMRLADKFTTCEIFRSLQTDNEGVNPGYTCNFMTPDNETYPLLPKSEEPEPANAPD